MKQEIDGPQAEQLFSCRKKLHKCSITEEVGHCPDKRPQIPHYWSQEDPLNCTHTESLEVKNGRRRHFTVSDVTDLFVRTHLGWETHAHTERILRYTKHTLRTWQIKWLAKWSPEEMYHKRYSNYYEGVTLSLSLPVHLSTHTILISNQHFTCFPTFHLYVEIHFYTAGRPGPCHWPLVPSG